MTILSLALTVPYVLFSSSSMAEGLLTVSNSFRSTGRRRGPPPRRPPFGAVVHENVDNHREFLVEVTYEGMSCEVSIRANETILSGLERANVMDQLAIPELPSDCRRGNCLTCVGRHTPTSHESSLQSEEDGLSPEMSRQVSKRGYILTCSSRVVGDGVKLELGEQYKVWKDVYYNRLYDESTQYVSRSAMARAIRMSDERNPDLWAVKTQTALQIGDGDNDDQVTMILETDGMA